MPESSQRFYKKEHLLDASDFQVVFRGGKRHNSATLTIIQYKNNLDIARLGLAISKKSLKKAVDRNRVKRIIREWFRINKPALNGNDYVVLSKSAITGVSKEILRDTLNTFITRIKGVTD